MRWLEALPASKRKFLGEWAKTGNGTQAYLAIHPAVSRNRAAVNASNMLRRLHAARLKWKDSGGSDSLPPLNRAWLLGLLDKIARKPGLTDRDLQNAMAQRQVLDPVDVRTYPDLRVVGLTSDRWKNKKYRAKLKRERAVAL